MVDRIKPVARDKLDQIIFHFGTNDILSDKDAEDIAISVVDLAMFVQFQTIASL